MMMDVYKNSTYIFLVFSIFFLDNIYLFRELENFLKE